MQEPKALLVAIISQRCNRRELIKAFQGAVWNTPKELTSGSPAEDELYQELAHDLDFYEPDPRKRAEDWSYYGDGELEKLVRIALNHLNETQK